MEIIPWLFSGLGLGSVITLLFQHLLIRSAAKKDRRDRELKEAYSGFLNAHSQLMADPNLDEKVVNFRYWVSRVELVCSKEILDMLLEMRGSNRKAATTYLDAQLLVYEMRRDLGVAETK
ncbi:hypothetical protein [Vreelandella neptunia]|uniref:hypothetical protein n=1 Tax=Vreelandella neptunia TaxID=115551 RepID=UPI00315AAC0C